MPHAARASLPRSTALAHTHTRAHKAGRRPATDATKWRTSKILTRRTGLVHSAKIRCMTSSYPLEVVELLAYPEDVSQY